jgi:ribonuclease P protein component
VVRNKVRRRIREIARREIDPEAGPVDMVFRANPRAATMDFESIYEAFTRQLRKAGLLDQPRRQQWAEEG